MPAASPLRPGPVAGVILAGGRATRLGGADKALLMVDGRPILAHALERLAPEVDLLAINANGDARRYAGFGPPVIADRLPPGVADFPGPLAGLLAGLDWAAAEGAAAVVTVAGDTPFFPLRLATVLEAAARAAGRPGAVAFSLGPSGPAQRHPVFGLWPVAAREPLRAALGAGMRRVMDFAGASGAARAVFGDPSAFRNANTAAELAALQGGAPG